VLLATVWIVEAARIVFPSPLLAGMGGACLAALTLAAFARASGHILGLFLFAAGVSAAIAAWLGSADALLSGFAKAQIFGAFLPSVLLLRATAEASPRIGAPRADLGRLGHAATQNWMQYGSHALGAVLNVGAASVLAPVVDREADPQRRLALARSSARGIGGAVMWSPFFLALAFIGQLVPHAPLWQSMAVGTGLAAMGLALSQWLFTPSLRLAEYRASLARLAPLGPPMLVAIGAVVGATVAFGWSGLQAVAVVVPVLCLAYAIRLGPAESRGIARRSWANFGRIGDELLVVVGATMLGAAVASLPAVRELGASVTPEMISGPVLVAALVAVLLLLGQAGLHPMIGASIVLPVVAAGPFGLCKAIVVAVGVFAWALNSSVSIWTMPVAVASSAFRVEPRQMVSRRSLQFMALHAVGGVLYLVAANALLVRLGCP